jgi:hypothetical protein
MYFIWLMELHGEICKFPIFLRLIQFPDVAIKSFGVLLLLLAYSKQCYIIEFGVWLKISIGD